MSRDRHLRGDPPQRFALEIIEIEAELEEIYPDSLKPVARGWGRPLGMVGTMRFNGSDEDRIRLKWLLQRRKALYSGRDSEISVRVKPGRGGRNSYVAFEIDPPAADLSPEGIKAAALRSRRGRSGRGRSGGYKPRTIEGCAAKLGISPMRAARLAATLPAGVELFDHLQKEATHHAPTKEGPSSD